MQQTRYKWKFCPRFFRENRRKGSDMLLLYGNTDQGDRTKHTTTRTKQTKLTNLHIKSKNPALRFMDEFWVDNGANL